MDKGMTWQGVYYTDKELKEVGKVHGEVILAGAVTMKELKDSLDVLSEFFRRSNCHGEEGCE